MKALILGASGQLGKELLAAAAADADVLVADRAALDITDADAVKVFITDREPEVVFNAAAYTAVDKAEAESELANAVNVDGARNVAKACAVSRARLVHFSTDFVFDGKAKAPYRPESPTAPLGVYGQSKLDGENAVLRALPNAAFVIRTSWLYSDGGHNFVRTMLRLMAERDSVSVVADQVGSPTWARGLALVAWQLAAVKAAPGVYHWCDGGETSWHGFAVAIQQIATKQRILVDPVPIHPISTSEFPTAAQRPAYSVLNCDATIAATGCVQAPWKDNLQSMLEGMKIS